MTEWWFNSRTNEVEEGPQSLSMDRIGPFETAEEASRALQIIEDRAKQWAAEEQAEGDWS